eukprot:Gb_41191 [translate_table: standard]
MQKGGLQMVPKGQELPRKPETRVERLARWQKEQHQAGRRLPKTMEPMQRYSRRADDMNPARNPDSSDKVIEETVLLAEMENCQLEARPSRACPNLTCGSNAVSNITHEPVEAINPKDSSRIPQGSTEGSPQGTDQSYTWQTPAPTGRAKGDPLVFDISTNSIKNLSKRLLGSDPKRSQEESNVTAPTNSRSFEEILESVINEFLKINLIEGEEGPSRCIVEEETSIDTTKESFESSDSSIKVEISSVGFFVIFEHFNTY